MSSHLGAALEAFRKQQAQKAAEAVQAETQPKVYEQLLALHLTRLCTQNAHAASWDMQSICLLVQSSHATLQRLHKVTLDVIVALAEEAKEEHKDHRLWEHRARQGTSCRRCQRQQP